MIPTHKFKDDKLREIRVVKLGSLSNYNIGEPHRHDYIELFVINKGGGSHEIDFVEFPVQPKSIHIVVAGRVHQMKRELQSDGFVILFHPSIFDTDNLLTQFFFELDCYDVNEFSPTFKFDPIIEDEIIHAAEKIWSYNQSKDDLRYHFMMTQLQFICLYCIQLKTEIDFEPNRDYKYYLQFRQELRYQFKTLKKVKEYAEILGITSRKLNDIVLAKTGLTVSKLIQNQLILEAKRLLNTGISSKEVTFLLNFEDPGHFSKFFKAQTKESPSDFQKRHVN